METKAAVSVPPKMKAHELSVFYGSFQAVHTITLPIRRNQVTALIGPSGCGKSTFLRALNRMNDLITGAHSEGYVYLDSADIYDADINVTILRQRVGMVFQRPNLFAMSIANNVLFGPRVLQFPRRQFTEILERSLRSANLWDEVKDKLNQSALGLSIDQQQRLCIARVLAVEPEVILLDEPCSALDPLATLKIEELLDFLKQRYTLVMVTHNMQQAARTSDFTGFFLQGELIEYGPTALLFSRPKEQRTEDYITGRFG